MSTVETAMRQEEVSSDETLYRHMKDALHVVTDAVLLWGQDQGASYSFTQQDFPVIRTIDFQSDLQKIAPLGIGLTSEERIKLYSKKDYTVYEPAHAPKIEEVALMYGKLAADYPHAKQTHELGKYLKGLMNQQGNDNPDLSHIREALGKIS